MATSAKVHPDLTSRERKVKRLAKSMYFKLTRQGDRYSLCRTVGLSGPARRENLTLDEVEEELETWKLRTTVVKIALPQAWLKASGST
jgi:hypothetical protein